MPISRDDAYSQYRSAYGGNFDKDAESDFQNNWNQAADSGAYQGASGQGTGVSWDQQMGNVRSRVNERFNTSTNNRVADSQSAQGNAMYGSGSGNASNAPGGGFSGSGNSSLGSFSSNFNSPQSIQAFSEQFRAPSLQDAQNSPGWQFRANEAQKQMERGAASKGNLLSGGMQAAMAGRMQDLASAEYDKIYGRAANEYGQRFNIQQANEMNRYNSQRGNVQDQFGFYTGERGMNRADRQDDFNIWNTMDTNYYNRMQGLANSGYNAAGQVSDLMTGAGNAEAAGTVGGANAWQDTLGNVGNQVVANQQQQQNNATLADMAAAQGGYGQWQTQPYGGYSPENDYSPYGGTSPYTF